MSEAKRALVCMFCGEGFGYEGEKPDEATLKMAVGHEKNCPKNPYKAEIDRLTTDFAKFKKMWPNHAAAYEDGKQSVLKELEQVKAESTEYRAALGKYGKHEPLCAVVGGYDHGCTCGLDEALKGKETGE